MDKQKTLPQILRRILPFLVFLLFISGVCVIVYKAQFRYDLHGSLTVEYKKKCLQALWYLLFLRQIICFIL